MFDVDLFTFGTVVQRLELAIDTQANIPTVPNVHYYGFRGPKVQNAKENSKPILFTINITVFTIVYHVKN